jgi:hypothetical protein
MDEIADRSETLRALFIEFASLEPMWVRDAAAKYGVRERTVRRWCIQHNIGTRLAGDWVVSGVRLRQFLVRQRSRRVTGV